MLCRGKGRGREGAFPQHFGLKPLLCCSGGRGEKKERGRSLSGRPVKGNEKKKKNQINFLHLIEGGSAVLPMVVRPIY